MLVNVALRYKVSPCVSDFKVDCRFSFKICKGGVAHKERHNCAIEIDQLIE